MSDIPVDRLNASLSGRYVVERELGEGGMATVFLADDLKHERKVALKVLKPELAAVVGGERFLAEIKTTANLHHPHILPLFDSGEADGFLFYVMPYVDGETLKDRLDRERQLPVEEALAITTAVASALQHAHDRGVIHRDIKPGNILLQDGQPVVSDFGIALAVGAAGGARLTETGLSVGTPYYMSPEQATGDQAIGPSSDTFALACVTYEMLVGEPPYPGSTAQAVLGKIIQGIPVSATGVRASVPANADAAIRKALEKLPADRFASADAFAKALKDPSFRHGETATVGSVAPGKRWNVLTTLFAAVAVLFAGVAAWALLDEEPPARVERYSDPFLDDQQPMGTGVGTFSLAPDGSAVAYVGQAGPGTIQLYLRSWGELEAIPLRGTEGGNQPSISPDGSTVAFHRSNQIHAIPIRGGPVQTVGAGQWPRWADDGSIYGMLGGVGAVRYAAGGTTADTVLHLEGDFQNYWPWSQVPGSDLMLTVVATGTGDVEIHVLDPAERTLAFLMEGDVPHIVESGHIVYLLDGALTAAPFDPRAMEVTGAPFSIASDVTDASLSRDGRLLYSSGSTTTARRQLVWVTRDGDMSPVDPNWTFVQGDVNTSWEISPDGSQVALREQIDGEYDIWVKQLDDGPRSRLTFDDRGDYFPMWTPDGASVTYVSGPVTNMDVYSRQADGTGEPELILDTEESIALAYWSPDRTWLILRTTTGAGNVFGRDIKAIRPGEDSVPVELMAEEHDEMDPALSPDGRWIAYGSNETGRFEVYIRPFPDVNAGKWQVSTNGGTGPVWAHDGEEIFFRDGNDNLAVAAVDGSGTAFVAQSPTVLFPIPDDVVTGELSSAFDVSNDDQRFLMARILQSESDEADAQPDFVLVQNFDEELRARTRD